MWFVSRTRSSPHTREPYEPARETTELVLKALALLTVLTLIGGVGQVRSASAEIQTITLLSGNGPVGSRDSLNKFTVDGGITFQDAFIVAPHPFYSLIPGTQYINMTPDLSGPQYTNTARFTTTFALPRWFSNPSLTIQVHADNVATVFLNGVQIGHQTFAEVASNFQDPPETFTAMDSALFRVGVNILEFDIFNFCCPTAFDYKAIVAFTQ
jgi:hypothetical protein